MCNMYSVNKTGAQIADFFGVSPAPEAEFNVPDEVLPGYPGLVIHEEGNARVLEPMTWGFPLRLKSMKPDAKPKPVNNIADLRKGMWIGLAKNPQWRCLIPATQFAEAEGPKGRMTRTWFSIRTSPCSPGPAFGASATSGARSIPAS
jgi:putative SOS response-associated peptidase YedK